MEQLLICMSLSLIAGLLASRAAKAIRLPAVTSYLVAGLLLGPFFLGRLGLSSWGFGFGSLAQVESYGIITQVALGFIAFVIGNEFRLSALESMGRQAVTVGILQAVITTVLVDIALVALHFARPDIISMASAITLGAIASATAPAATLMVVKQYKATAQCTDERVNKTTPTIFLKYDTPQDFANADIHELEELVHPCGFYKNKAKNLKLAGEKIMKDFNGVVPQTMEELMTIPGVGRKSANVIMLEAFNMPQGIAVDTHCKRIANRLGFSKETEPSKIEQDLLKVIPREYYKDVNHIFIWHGRNLCTSQNPKCDKCPLKNYCKFH